MNGVFKNVVHQVKSLQTYLGNCTISIRTRDIVAAMSVAISLGKNKLGKDVTRMFKNAMQLTFGHLSVESQGSSYLLPTLFDFTRVEPQKGHCQAALCCNEMIQQIAILI